MGHKKRQEPGVLAWHWPRADRRLGYGDGRLVEVGQTLEMLLSPVHPSPILCWSGMHASICPLDALAYAESNTVCRVVVSGDVVFGNDKIVGRRRTVLAMGDVENVLRAFARRVALDVADLWDMPPLVRRYLETGDESLRDAAAWDAALAVAWDAAGYAAKYAARYAALAAARVAARVAARDAARVAARVAARYAALAAARENRGRLLHEMLCKELGCE